MTTDGNWSAPDPHPGASRSQQWREPSSPNADPGRIESLLHSLINRLEENDDRYNSALSNLEQRLNELSNRAETVNSGAPGATAEALNRVGTQAADLAQQVRSAEQAHGNQPPPGSFRGLEDRIGEFAAHLQQTAPVNSPGAPAASSPPPAYAGTFGERFANAATSFEQSLAAGQPTAELDALNARMSDLIQRFDSATASRADAAALQSIEAQLNNLAAQFAQAQQQYGRVDAIEANLVRLMEWAQQSGSQVEAAAKKAAHETALQMGGEAKDVAGRLDAVQQELHALNARALEIDGRTVDTLESMNSALKSLTGQIAAKGEAASPTSAQATPEPPQPSPAGPPASTPPAANAGQPPVEQAPAANAAPELIPVAADPARSRVGAAIPDYHEPPGAAAAQPGAVENGAATAPPPGQTGQQQVFDDTDFLAAARRASAAAAAAQPVQDPKRKSLFSGLFRKAQSRPAAAQESKGSRPLLVIGAVLLLVAGSNLIYGRLKDKAASPVGQAPAQLQRSPSATTPSISPSDPARPQTSEKKDYSKLPTQPATTSQDRPKRAPLVIEKPATAPGQQTRLDADVAPKLASLPKPEAEPQYPGIAITITDTDAPAPPQRAPAPIAARQAAPLASEPQAARPPAPQPRAIPRAPEPAAVPAPARAQSAALPPAAIGPQSLRLAAAKGNAKAQFEIGSRYARGSGVTRDYKKAAEWYARAAAQSLAPAQYRLAALYERGRGLEKDPAMARVWYERAAKLGNVKAMHNLAVILTGTGGNRSGNQDEALRWFKQAARHGLADSQFNLGIIYEGGLGVKKSALEAYQWFSLAAERGDKEAEKRKQRVKLQLKPSSLRLAEQSVRLWRAKPTNAEANDVRPPRGGWRSVAATPNTRTANRALVARAQTLLNKLGYSAGVPDGVTGPQTVKAIRRFETRSGLTASGRVTPELVKRLEALIS